MRELAMTITLPIAPELTNEDLPAATRELNRPTRTTNVPVYIDPECEPRGKTDADYNYDLSVTWAIVLREWNEQVLLHELLHIILAIAHPDANNHKVVVPLEVGLLPWLTFRDRDADNVPSDRGYTYSNPYVDVLSLDALMVEQREWFERELGPGTLLKRVAKVAEEAGELVGAVIKSNEPRPDADEHRIAAVSEVADVILAALGAADTLGIKSVEQVVREKWAIVSARRYATAVPGMELPGMWEESDFLGGAPDVVRGAESAIHDGRPAACRPETCGGIHYDPCEPMTFGQQEQREAYAEAILDAAGSTPLGLEFRYTLAEACTEVGDQHTADLRDRIEFLESEAEHDKEGRAEWFEKCQATEACLREREAEVEMLRQAHKAWQETSRSVSAAVAHHWRDTKDALKKAKATIAELGGLAQLHATSAHNAEAKIARVEAVREHISSERSRMRADAGKRERIVANVLDDVLISLDIALRDPAPIPDDCPKGSGE